MGVKYSFVASMRHLGENIVILIRYHTLKALIPSSYCITNTNKQKQSLFYYQCCLSSRHYIFLKEIAHFIIDSTACRPIWSGDVEVVSQRSWGCLCSALTEIVHILQSVFVKPATSLSEWLLVYLHEQRIRTSAGIFQFCCSRSVFLLYPCIRSSLYV